MKLSKKIAMAAVAITMCATSFAMAACDKTHTHTYGDWQVTTPPTCSADGEESRKCSDCDEQEKRPVNKLGHKYGEFEVTQMPTDTAEGTAKKVCENDSAHGHDITVTLPVLIDKAYKTEVGTDAIAYTYTTEDGDVTFTVPVTAGGALNVAFVNKHKVISGTGKKYAKIYSTTGMSTADIFYEFGDDYVHIQDGTQYVEKWYTRLENGDIFAVSSRIDSSQSTQVEKAEYKDLEETFEGFGFNFFSLMDDKTVYGLENFVKYFYDLGLTDINHDFTEKSEKVDGKTVYSFSYSYYRQILLKASETDEEEDVYTTRFYPITVEFALDENCVMTDVSIDCYLYSSVAWSNQVGPPNSDGKPSGGFAETGLIEKTANGYKLVEGKEGEYDSYAGIDFTQKSTLGEGEETPVSPYIHDEMIVKSFKVYDSASEDKTEIANGDTVTFTPATSKTLYLDEIVPVTANLSFDAPKFYVEKDGEREELSFKVTATDGDINVFYNKEEKKAVLNFLVTGDFDIVIATEEYEFKFTAHVPVKAPSDFSANVHDFDEVSETDSWKVSDTATVYTGGELNFNAKIPHPVYEETAFTATVKDASGADVTAQVLTDGYVEGVPVKVFKAQTAGVYTVTLKSSYAGSNITATLSITVEQAPEVSDVLKGQYTNPNDLAVTFTPASEGATSGTAEIVFGDYNTVYEYAYDADSGEISLNYVSGAQEHTSGIPFEYALELSPKYNLFLVYKDEVGESVRANVVTEKEDLTDGVSGTYALGSKGAADVLTVNKAGKYNFSATDYTCFVVEISEDGETWRQEMLQSATDLDLEKGWKVLAWSPMGGNKYTIAPAGGSSGGDEKPEVPTLNLGANSVTIEDYVKIVYTFEVAEAGKYTFTLDKAGVSIFTKAKWDGWGEPFIDGNLGGTSGSVYLDAGVNELVFNGNAGVYGVNIELTAGGGDEDEENTLIIDEPNEVVISAGEEGSTFTLNADASGNIVLSFQIYPGSRVTAVHIRVNDRTMEIANADNDFTVTVPVNSGENTIVFGIDGVEDAYAEVLITVAE